MNQIVMTPAEEDGTFQLTVPSATSFGICALARGLAPMCVSGVAAGVPLTLKLQPGGTITGTLKDSLGRPLARGKLSSWPLHLDEQLRMLLLHLEAAAEADDAGQFQLSSIGSGPHEVLAVKQGYASEVRTNIHAGQTLAISLDPGGQIAGSVTDMSGTALAGAKVIAEVEDPSREARASDVTGLGGSFDFPYLRLGSHRLVVEREGFAPTSLSGVIVAGGKPRKVTVVLARGSHVWGRLVNASGRGVSGGQLRARTRDGQGIPPTLARSLSVQASRDGLFSIDQLGAGRWVFEITVPGFPRKWHQVMVGARPGELPLGDIVIEAKSGVRGRVRSVSGVAVGGAKIRALPVDLFASEGGEEVQSSSDGTFSLWGLGAGRHVLRVEAPGYASTVKELPAKVRTVEIVLSPGGSVAGLAVDERGEPVPSVSVTGRRSEPVRDDEEHTAFAEGAGGRFLLENLPAGVYTVQIAATGLSPETLSSIEVQGGRSTDLGTVRLRAGCSLSGVVRDEAGRGLQGATLRVLGARSASLAGPALEATSDANGEFSVGGLPSGRVRLLVRQAEYAPTEVSLDLAPAENATIEVTLHSGGAIRGSAHRRDGSPLQGVTVAAHTTTPASPTGMATTTGLDGSFEFSHVPPGRTLLTLSERTRPGEETSLATRSVDVREGELSLVTFRLQDILLVGHVTRGGAPAGGIDLRLWSERSTAVTFSAAELDGPPLLDAGPRRLQATTAADGSFALLVEAPGRYSVQMRSPERQIQYPVRMLEIPDVDRHLVRLALPIARVNGRVVDSASQAPIEEAAVSVRSRTLGAPLGAEAVTDAAGRFGLDVDAGNYELLTSRSGYASEVTPVEVGDSDVVELTVELSPDLAITGEVHNPWGQPASGVALSARAVKGTMSSDAMSGGDGTFEIRGIAAQLYNLCAASPGVGYAVALNVAPQGERVNLVLRPGGMIRVSVRDRSGRAVAGALAAITRVDGALVRVPLATGRVTNSGGIFEIAGPAGELEIAIQARGTSTRVRARVSPGSVAYVEATLED
jgi:hypothetical protein